MRPLARLVHSARTSAFLFALLTGCTLGSSGIQTAPGWKATSLAAWRHAHPDMLALSKDRKWLYITGETNAGMSAPSLMVIHLPNGRHHILLNGLHRADGLKLAPDGSLWIGEEFDQGLIWRIAEPDRLPTEQVVDRQHLDASHPAISYLPWAGRFAHEGISFSKDQHYAYLADEHPYGALYRLDLKRRKLQVLHPSNGWLNIDDPAHARKKAISLHARTFNRIEDMETLPDGTVLMAETGAGRILALYDNNGAPSIKVYLQRPEISHPDNLAWDNQRHWLWITDDDKPSRLWAWDGDRLMRIASHDKAEITGVLADGDAVYFNLQRKGLGVEITMKLTEEQPSRDDS